MSPLLKKIRVLDQYAGVATEQGACNAFVFPSGSCYAPAASGEYMFCLGSSQYEILEDEPTEPESKPANSIREIFGQDLNEITVRFK